MRLSHGEPADAGAIKVAGVVREVAYFGDVSRVVVTPDAGPPLAVSIPNDARQGGTAIARDQRVWVSWSPADMFCRRRDPVGSRLPCRPGVGRRA